MTHHQWLEIPVFVHGITPTDKPGTHHAEYHALYMLIQEELQKIPDKQGFDHPPLEVEWGWDSGQAETNDRYLAEAELIVAEQALAAEKRIQDLTINPLRLIRRIVREVFIYGVADMFYYVSKDGEAALREHVFKYLCDEIQKIKGDGPGKISVTFITHSGGTIIAHDLLYHLFREAKESEIAAVKPVREMAQTGQLRVRRFYTMGSPITPLIFRADSLIAKIREGKRLNPEHIGLRQQDGLADHPRWVNFVDKDDMACYPVAFLYVNESGVIEDKHIDVGDAISLAHGGYWYSRKLARYIAETF